MYFLVGDLRKQIWINVGIFFLAFLLVIYLYVIDYVSAWEAHFTLYICFVACLLYQFIFINDPNFRAEYFHSQLFGFKVAVRFLAIILLSFGVVGIFTFKGADLNIYNFLRFVAMLSLILITFPEVRCFLKSSRYAK